jgi:hypothetical protein
VRVKQKMQITPFDLSAATDSEFIQHLQSERIFFATTDHRPDHRGPTFGHPEQTFK